MNQKTLFISVSLIIVISFIIAIEIFQPKQSGNNITASNISALERINAPTKGPKNAKNLSGHSLRRVNKLAHMLYVYCASK